MAAPKQWKRVSWAPDQNLCQVRLFLSEETPQSCVGIQQTLQAKASWLWHAAEVGSDDSLPPGYKIPHAAYKLKKEISQIPSIKWQCPSKIVLNPNWLVEAGKDSEEATMQIHRERRVLEAIYPRMSSIPSNPAVSSEVQNTHQDINTPLIPITAIEEEDFAEKSDILSTSDTYAQLQQPDVARSLPGMAAQHALANIRFGVDQLQSNPHNVCYYGKMAASTAPGTVPDITTAASAAFTAIMSSSEDERMANRDLLIKILGNPRLLENLVSEIGIPKQPASSLPAPLPARVDLGGPSLAPSTHEYATTANPALYQQPLPAPAIQISSRYLANAPLVKDLNYYKGLIQQHGEEKQEALDRNAVQFRSNDAELIGCSSKQREVFHKFTKPCHYFNSPKGCRHGDNCFYQHDATISQHVEQQGETKRTRLDGGIERWQ